MSPICACCDRHSRHRPPGPMNTNMCMRKTWFFFWKESQNSLPTEGPDTSLYLTLFLHSLNFPISCLQSLLLLGIQGHRSPSALVSIRLRICQALTVQKTVMTCLESKFHFCCLRHPPPGGRISVGTAGTGRTGTVGRT